MSDKSVIITAGGFGKRMNSDLPKQFILLAGKPILAHTIEAFYNFETNIQILVTLPKDWMEYWKNWQVENNFKIEHQIIAGGEERFHSIQNALQQTKGKFIAIHDGVRPFISAKLLENLFTQCTLSGNAIPVLPIKESIRMKTEESSIALVRSNYFTVQTPQVFKKEQIFAAYKRDFHSKITDDASLVEENGSQISLIEGRDENIKITTPLDLLLAESIIKNNANKNP